ncbi:structural maintenance of chromosomes protein [Plakobranchus ocellatus]|uniref:Structural maintenance of chromosomes protein n=1 Tax=Plakobranchus ocellatus TaxID=259542 RepID=A0AAV4ACR7_9GAST|nr:structural maintenance of chromosomes protein [Plakobranchus ocellatus]
MNRWGRSRKKGKCELPGDGEGRKEKGDHCGFDDQNIIFRSVHLRQELDLDLEVWAYVYLYFETLDHLSFMATSKKPAIISTKLEALKKQKDDLSKALFTKIDRLDIECERALQAANNDSYVTSMVESRIDSFTELLQSVQLQLQGSHQVTSLLQRVEKLENLCSSQQLSSISTLENQTAQLLKEMTETQKSMSEIPDMKQKLEALTNSVVVFHKTSDDLATKLSNQQAQVDTVAVEVANLNEQVKHAKSKQKELKQQVIKAEAESGEASHFFAKKVSSLEKLRKILNEERRRAEGKPQMKQMYEESERQLQLLNDDIKNLNNQTAQLQKEMTETQKSMAEVPDMKQKLEALTNSVVVFHKTSDDLATKSGEASNLLAQKVSSLEKLRESLDKERCQTESKPQMKQMYEETQRQLQVLNDDIKNIKSHTRPQVGFTVQLHFEENFHAGKQISGLFNVITNVGDCFRPFEGHFVAPHNGLYCFCVKLEQKESKVFTACIMTKELNFEAKERLKIPIYCGAPHSALCLLQVKANDHVFVKIVSAEDTIKFNDSYIFSGWSIFSF